MICNDCGHIFINELVEVCQYGYGDNTTEYVVCPECGRMQRVHPVHVVISRGSTGRV